MFGNNKNSEDNKKSSATNPSAPSSNALNALVKGTVVEGNVRCDSDLRVDGAIKGHLDCQAKVIIGPTGSVDGEIRCQNAVIEGKFKGKLFVSDLLNIRETADVEGDISTGKLIVQSGAKFNVNCKMETGSSNGTAKNFEGKSPNNNAAQAAQKISGGKEEIRN